MARQANVVPFRHTLPARPSRSNRVALTSKRVADATPDIGPEGQPKRTRIADDTVRGLSLSISSRGAKSWVARGRLGKGRDRPVIDINLGPVDAVPLSEARERARTILVRLRAGEDPRQEAAEDITVRELVETFIDHQRNRGVVSILRIDDYLGRATRRLGAMPAGMVSRAQWAAGIAAIERRSGPEAARSARAHVKSMLRWADDQGLVENSPGLRLSTPDPSKRVMAARRARAEARWTLRRRDWSVFWAAAGSASDPIFAALLRALMLTGLRKSEAATAFWSDVDDGTWTVPGTRRKNGMNHRVHVGPLLRQVLDTLPGGSSSQLVFPGRGDRPISGWTQRIAPVSAVLRQPVSLHGLRRGYRTELAELGADVDLAERMIGHSRDRLVATYDRSDRWNERVALQHRFEAAVTEAVDG